jgi:hypothetical protein
MTYKDLIWQLSNKIVELSKLQNELILDNVNNLDTEATEEDKEKVNIEIGGI